MDSLDVVGAGDCAASESERCGGASAAGAAAAAVAAAFLTER